jgi:hypothetical protein
VKWFSSRKSSRKSNVTEVQGKRKFRPQIEILEGRLVPSNLQLTVTSADDDPSGPTPGVVTLRDAINLVNSDAGDVASSPDTIQFAIAGTPTIVLADDLPALTNPVLLDGSTQAGVTVDGQASSGVNFSEGYAVLIVSSAVTVSSMTFTDGVLTVNAGASLSTDGDFTLGDAASDSTLVQNDSSVSVGGNVVAGGNVGVNNDSDASFQVNGGYAGGLNSYVNNFGNASFSVTGDVVLDEGGYITNGGDFTSTDTASFKVGGSLSIGMFGSVTNDGKSTISVSGNLSLGTFGTVDNGEVRTDAATLTVGGSISMGASSATYNQGTSVLTVNSGFTMGSGGFVFNGTSSTDAATLTVWGAFSLGVSGGTKTFVANEGASKLAVTGNFTLLGKSSFVNNGVFASDSATLTVGGNFALDASGFVKNLGTSALSVGGGFTLGAGSYFIDNGTLSVGGAFDPGSGSSVSNDLVAGTFNAGPHSTVTTDAATWKVQAGGKVNVAGGATFNVVSTFEVMAGGKLLVGAGASLDVAAGSTLKVDGGSTPGVVTNRAPGRSKETSSQQRSVPSWLRATVPSREAAPGSLTFRARCSCGATRRTSTMVRRWAARNWTRPPAPWSPAAL